MATAQAQGASRPGRLAAGRSERQQAATLQRPGAAPARRGPAAGGCPCGGGCPRCAAGAGALHGPGRPLERATRQEFEPLLGADLGAVRLHLDQPAPGALAARAFTRGSDIAFAPGQYAPGTAAGRRLLAHELAHVVQQRRGPGLQGGAVGRRGDAAEREADAAAGAMLGGAAWRIRETAAHLQRDEPATGAAPAAAPAADSAPEADAAESKDPRESDERFTGPLDDREWQQVDAYLAAGRVEFEPLTADASRNAQLVAGAIFCSRALSTLVMQDGGDPLLCLDTAATLSDPRVQKLAQNVAARGPIVHWPAVPSAERMRYVVDRLVRVHGYPVNAAAGIVGNLQAESGVLPSRVEGSAGATPLRARGFRGRTATFTPQQVMDRSKQTKTGPEAPGVGLAQWTTTGRRAALFQQTGGGDAPLGASVLFNMDAQIDFLASELKASKGLNDRLTNAAVTVDQACDDVVYDFEIPGAILDGKRKRPRSDPAVQAVFRVRRGNAQAALRAYQAAQQQGSPQK